MHSYIFDYFLHQKKYEKIVAQIETRLTDLGLQGKNFHVGPLQNFKSIVKNELKHGPKTIVVIGNNSTFNQLINAADGIDTTLGIIPIGTNNSLAQTLGINDVETACNVLSARLVETIDVGMINDYSFISNATINNQGTIIEVNGKYTVEPEGSGEINVVNLTLHPQKNKGVKYGSLGIYINVNKKRLLKQKIDTSFIQTNKIIIHNLQKYNFTLDDAIEIKPPAIFSVKKNAFKIIVGKNRVF